MNHYLLIASLFFVSLSVNATETSLFQPAIDGDHRSTQHKNRDQYRHPEKTLDFFEVKSNMTVVEIWPGGKGWYTEILAPFLRDKGTFYAAQFSAESNIPYFTLNLQKFNDKIKAHPAIYGNINVTTLYPPLALKIAPKGTADRVLTFRNVHNWMKNGQVNIVFTAMHDALKKGGILGVVEHRAKKGSQQDPKALSGYVTEAHVIQLAEKAGFKLLAKSEINANPKDSTVHPKGVWTLPPSLKLKDNNKDKYLSIGESDRMTLSFIKQ